MGLALPAPRRAPLRVRARSDGKPPGHHPRACPGAGTASAGAVAPGAVSCCLPRALMRPFSGLGGLDGFRRDDLRIRRGMARIVIPGHGCRDGDRRAGTVRRDRRVRRRSPAYPRFSSGGVSQRKASRWPVSGEIGAQRSETTPSAIQALSRGALHSAGEPFPCAGGRARFAARQFRHQEGRRARWDGPPARVDRGSCGPCRNRAPRGPRARARCALPAPSWRAWRARSARFIRSRAESPARRCV